MNMKWDRFTPEAKSLKLYGYWRSSNTWRVRWALELKKIPYSYIPVNLLKIENKSPEHLARNPMGALPVLEINEGIYLSQSIAILEWIEEVYSLTGPAIYPGTPLERAQIRSLCEFINADTTPVQTPRIQKHHSTEAAQQKAWAVHFIREGLSAFDVVSRPFRKTFSFYNEISAADLCLVPQIYNALRYEIAVEKDFPELWQIYQRALATSACQTASPEKQIDAPVSV